MLNSIGLQNIGVRAFVRDKLPELRELGVATFANIFGYAVEDYVEVGRVLEDAEGLAGYELNVSCPNTKHGGIYFSSDPALLAEVVSAVRKAASHRPLIVKLSPNVAHIEPLARAAAEAGADAISLVNTFVALAIDPRTRKPRLGAGMGGLSGPAIKPIALRMVYEAAQAVNIPVIGLGGIATGEDAAEFLIAGASAVQVGTANFWDPRAPERIAEELDQFLEQENVARAADLVGTFENMKKIVSTEQAPKAIGPYSQAVVSNGFAFLSGQIPLDPATGQLIEGDVEAQTVRVLENLKAVLEACGSSLARVVKTTVFLKDMGEFARMNEVYAGYFPENPPARATVEAARLPRDVRVEIDCIAEVGLEQPLPAVAAR